jgi:hypothetical protein
MRGDAPSKVKNCPCPTCSGSPDLMRTNDPKQNLKPASPKSLKERAMADVYKEAKTLIKEEAQASGNTISARYYDLLLAIWRYEDVMNLPETDITIDKKEAL